MAETTTRQAGGRAVVVETTVAGETGRPGSAPLSDMAAGAAAGPSPWAAAASSSNPKPFTQRALVPSDVPAR
ncbi:hypothetical protein AB0G32_05980 [Streptomyces sp. NPDC023723]|uniref:hypothetical protein n=1 Tax=Streptomyces sp. NPDC023723 TaxID=3154323 RepID=UPI003411AD48